MASNSHDSWNHALAELALNHDLLRSDSRAVMEEILGGNRTQEEIADWRNNRDPIDRFSAQLISEGLLSQDDFVSMQSEVTAQINAAVEFAEQSPYPDLSTIYEDVDSGLLGVRK